MSSPLRQEKRRNTVPLVLADTNRNPLGLSLTIDISNYPKKYASDVP